MLLLLLSFPVILLTSVLSMAKPITFLPDPSATAPTASATSSPTPHRLGFGVIHDPFHFWGDEDPWEKYDDDYNEVEEFFDGVFLELEEEDTDQEEATNEQDIEHVNMKKPPMNRIQNLY